MDIALAGDEVTGEIVVHRVDCPVVRKWAFDGHPVMTLLGCEGPLPTDYPRHSCLTETKNE